MRRAWPLRGRARTPSARTPLDDDPRPPRGDRRKARGPGCSGLPVSTATRLEPGLLIPRCASVHTFGMRFPLDLVFLDRDGRPFSFRRAVPPRRLAFDRRAAAVLELPCPPGELRS